MALLRRGNRIAVLEVFGAIGAAVRPSVYVPLVEAARKNRKVRVMILDIDSPGGTAAASAEMYLAIKRFSETKPVVAYIRGTGASGAYYISCAAQRIIAMPESFVGSIGVIAVRPIVEDMMQRIGVTMHVQKSGRLKDMLQPWRPPTDEEQGKIQDLLDDVYAGFIRSVATGRRMDEDRVRELATGEVYTARRAAELGLVDTLGDMEAAIDAAVELSGSSRRTVHLRARRPFMRRLFGGVTEDLASSIAAEMEARLWGRIQLR